MYCEHQMGDFGSNPFKRLFKAPAKLAKRATLIVKDTGKALARGNIVKALSIANPVGVAIRMTTDNQKKIDKMSLITPFTVGAIKDKDLRKKAMIGYGAAAVVASAVAVAGGMALTGSGAAAATGTTGAAVTAGTAGAGAGTAAAGAGAIGTATKVADLASKVFGKKGGGGEGQEGAEGAGEQPFLAGMMSNKNVLLFMGLSALTVAGYMFFNAPMKNPKRRMKA